jgi:hypothetical protein
MRSGELPPLFGRFSTAPLVEQRTQHKILDREMVVPRVHVLNPLVGSLLLDVVWKEINRDVTIKYREVGSIASTR